MESTSEFKERAQAVQQRLRGSSEWNVDTPLFIELLNTHHADFQDAE